MMLGRGLAPARSVCPSAPLEPHVPRAGAAVEPGAVRQERWVDVPPPADLGARHKPAQANLASGVDPVRAQLAFPHDRAEVALDLVPALHELHELRDVEEVRRLDAQAGLLGDLARG